jgi:hypothetical protein
MSRDIGRVAESSVLPTVSDKRAAPVEYQKLRELRMAAARWTERSAMFSLRRKIPRPPRLAAVFAMCAAAILLGAGTARAAPVPIGQAPPPGAGQSCSFALSAPQVTELPGGAKVATATYAASRCSGSAQPVFATVCVASPDGPGQCFKNYGWLVAQVYVASPSVSGQFTATGLGCWQVGSAEFTCVPDGPVRATL